MIDKGGAFVMFAYGESHSLKGRPTARASEFIDGPVKHLRPAFCGGHLRRMALKTVTALVGCPSFGGFVLVGRPSSSRMSQL